MKVILEDLVYNHNHIQSKAYLGSLYAKRALHLLDKWDDNSDEENAVNLLKDFIENYSNENNDKLLINAKIWLARLYMRGKKIKNETLANEIIKELHEKHNIEPEKVIQ